MKLGSIFTTQKQQQSMEWKHHGSPRPKKFRVQKSAEKVLASYFWNLHGVIDLENCQTITGAYYSELITTLREKIKEKKGQAC
jgi:hypothetical protein